MPLIAKMELADGLFSTYRKAQGIAAISPWSNWRLPLRTFVHACFVWFGLWHFWRPPAHLAGAGPVLPCAPGL